MPAPGPKSADWHRRCTKHFKGLSSQVTLFPVAFESGRGCVLVDVDGNRYLDFSSGIYVATLGHCHPKISEAVAFYAGQLMNAHDFTTPIKARLVEKLCEVLPGDLRVPTLRFGHGGGGGGDASAPRGQRPQRDALLLQRLPRKDLRRSLAGADPFPGLRAHAGSRGHMLPRPDTYRPLWSKADGAIDTDKYIDFYDEYISKGTTGDVAGFVLEPIQGWAGSIFPPQDFFPKLRAYCDRHNLLLMADEVLTCWGRTGKWLCLDHWGVVPDVVTLGKGFGNGFPVTCVAVREPYQEMFEKISASSSYGGSPMACAVALAATEVIEEENLLEHAECLGRTAQRRMERMRCEHPIIGDVRVKGCLMGIELVKDR